MTLIKNNLKLMLRCKGLVLIVLCMVTVTGMLSVAFDSFMTDSYEIESGTVGYSFSKGCKYQMLEPYFKAICEDNKLEAIALTEGSAKAVIDNNKTDYFAEFTDDGCVIYSDKEHESQAGILKVIVNSLLTGSNEQSISCIEARTIKTLPIADSTLYYTIAYLVFGIWLSMVVLAVITSSERKNKIGVRMRTTPVSSLKIYLCKFVTAFITILTLLAAEVIIVTPLFDIEWKKQGICILILVLNCMAAAAVSTVIFTLIRNMMAAITVGYGLIMFWGFIGGSFAPYYYMYYGGLLEAISPIYHVNRALVELNVSGTSEYTTSAILFMLGITLVCVPLGMLSIKMVKEK